MWPVLRAHAFWQVKHSCKWSRTCQARTKVNSFYKIAADPGFHVPNNKLTCKRLSSGNSFNGDSGKHYDKYFYFIHQNDLYQNTTFNYNLLCKSECSEEMPDLLSKIAIPVSDIEKNVQQLTDEELQETMKCLINRKISNKFRILYYLDEECAKRTLKWTVVTSLIMLDGWVMVDEKFTFSGKFFTVLRNLWCQQLRYCTKQNLVQMVYYLGRSKEPAPGLLLDRMEKALLQYSNAIVLNEWGIICNGFFKMKTKIKSVSLLQHIANVAIQQLKKHDKYILISILKAFRLTHYFDKKFIGFVEDFVRETHEDYNVIECAHFLAMFANVGWYNQEVFDSLEKQAVNKLVSATKSTDSALNSLSSFDIRIKDVARLLWSVSYTGHKPKSDAFCEIMISAVKEFMEKDFNKNLLYIVDCAQSLIIMGHYCDNIIRKLLTKDTLKKLKHSVKKKPFNQWHFIYSSVNIEAPMCKNENFPEDISQIQSSSKSTYKDTRERMGVEQLIAVMRKYCNEKEEFTHSFILPHIAISSVCIETNSGCSHHHLHDKTSNLASQQMKFSLEVLDPTVCLGNYQHLMTGLMSTKVRQLRKLNYGVIMFTPEAIRRMNDMAADNLRLYIDNLFMKAVDESVVTIK